VPRKGHLEALSRALGVDTTELASALDVGRVVEDGKVRADTPAADVPTGPAAQSRSPASEATPVIQVEDFGAEMHIVVDQRMPWEQALQILQALKAHRQA
jgi:hypothetical protein